MKRPREMASLSSFLNTYVQPKTEARPKPKPPGVVAVASAVVLTQPVHYRTFGGKNKFIRPGHKMIPRGAVGIVKTMADDGKSLEVAFRQPVVGTLHVSAQEVKLLEK